MAIRYVVTTPNGNVYGEGSSESSALVSASAGVGGPFVEAYGLQTRTYDDETHAVRVIVVDGVRVSRVVNLRHQEVWHVEGILREIAEDSATHAKDE